MLNSFVIKNPGEADCVERLNKTYLTTSNLTISGVNTSDVTPKVGRPQSEYVDEVREKLAEVTVRLGARSGAAGSGKAPASSTGAQMFEETTPMLVMPFPIFLAQGRIMKSTKKWREEALAKQWLVEYDESSGKVVIFVSHT